MMKNHEQELFESLCVVFCSNKHKHTKPHKITIVVIEICVSIMFSTAQRTKISVIFHLPKSQLDRHS